MRITESGNVALTIAAVQIERSLAENKSSADHQRLYEGLSSNASEAISEARRAGLEVLADGRSEILRAQDKAEHNRPLCHAMLARFRSEVQPAMQTALAGLCQRTRAGMQRLRMYAERLSQSRKTFPLRRTSWRLRSPRGARL
jgi:hypothetical protein